MRWDPERLENIKGSAPSRVYDLGHDIQPSPDQEQRPAPSLDSIQDDLCAATLGSRRESGAPGSESR